ncbi:hypothetical protein OG588_22055 [Streptomyces prunicolor]|uniref:hypothetical protein n=1 Tax=Streptomyces prunicolor TaxID=67348 RepID=UPI003863E2AE|nr:hypothetical protein OG588_22055 [Streptomyces prunicolor]
MSAADNKALVIAFYERAFNDYQPERAAAHLGDRRGCGRPWHRGGADPFSRAAVAVFVYVVGIQVIGTHRSEP